MGKPSGKKKRSTESKTGDSGTKHSKSGASSTPRAFDRDTDVFIDMSRQLKEEGNSYFQKREYETAILTYEKAVRLLPKNHMDVAYLRGNLATCYMQMNPGDFHRAINECNLALEVSPRYSKALLKRSRCYEALNRLEWAFRDVNTVLNAEPKNLTALEISERLKLNMEKQGIKLDDKLAVPVPEPVVKREKEKTQKKKGHKTVDKVVVKEENYENHDSVDEKEETKKGVEAIDDKNHANNNEKEEPKKSVKLVHGEDIRWAQIPLNCSTLQLREVVQNRFPGTEAVLIKYKDKEGDLVTITTNEELRWAEESADPQGTFRLYIVEVNPEKDPLLVDRLSNSAEDQNSTKNQNGIVDSEITKNNEEMSSTHIDNWITEFARLFSNHVGFDSNEYMDLHRLGMKLYSEAMENVVTSEEAQELFELAEHKFHDMAALALFNWGNVHMSRARKRLFLPGDASTESILLHVKNAYEWAQSEYVKAGKKYEEALRIKPDFYEGLLALGQQQFEQAKLSWYYAIGSKTDLQSWPSAEVLELFNSAEDSMERGTEMWEESEERRLRNLSKPSKEKEVLHKVGLSNLYKGLSTDEAAERASDMRSQINLLWGTMLYERSVVEFMLGLPIWSECLDAAIERFKLAGATPTDIAVMLKNHCSNENAQEGLSFKIDEIVQAWNEMYDAKRWENDVPSFRLEPLFRRCVPKLHHTLEHL